MAVRLLTCAWWALWCELRGLAGLARLHLTTLGRQPRVDQRAYRLRKQWLGSQLGGCAGSSACTSTSTVCHWPAAVR